MTKTFKITIGILIVLALAAGGVFSVSRKKIQQEQNAEERMNNEETFETFKEAEGVGAEKVEEITAGDIDTSDWKTYRNEEYNYSFKYPEEVEIMGDGHAAKPTQSYSISVYPRILNIEVQDPKRWQSASNSETIEIMNLKLKEFTEKKWQLNKEDKNSNIKNKKVGNIEDFFLDGRRAYQFTLTEAYQDERGGYLLNSEYLYVFVDNAEGLKYMIWLPNNNKISKAILETFKFLN